MLSKIRELRAERDALAAKRLQLRDELNTHYNQEADQQMLNAYKLMKHADNTYRQACVDFVETLDA